MRPQQRNFTAKASSAHHTTTNDPINETADHLIHRRALRASVHALNAAASTVGRAAKPMAKI